MIDWQAWMGKGMVLVIMSCVPACGSTDPSPVADALGDISTSDETSQDSDIEVIEDGGVSQDTLIDTGTAQGEGGWPTGECAEEITGTGNKAGMVAHDFTQTNQYGHPLRLYDYCHQVVLLVGAAYW